MKNNDKDIHNTISRAQGKTSSHFTAFFKFKNHEVSEREEFSLCFSLENQTYFNQELLNFILCSLKATAVNHQFLIHSVATFGFDMSLNMP